MLITLNRCRLGYVDEIAIEAKDLQLYIDNFFLRYENYKK